MREVLGGGHWTTEGVWHHGKKGRVRERERKGHFKVILEDQLRYYASADRKKLTFVCFR